MLSIVVTQKEHIIFTQRWLAEIGRNNMKSKIITSNAKKGDILNAAKKVYFDHPEILKALGL